MSTSRTFIAASLITLCAGSAYYFYGEYQNEKLRAETAERHVESQGQVIATQAFNLNRFNRVATYTRDLNALIAVDVDKKNAADRERMKGEKNCDLLIPSDVADGLYEYAHRLRTDALHTDSPGADRASFGPTTARGMTYCQAVLWIRPLLRTIESANNQLAGIRVIEQERK